LITIITQNKNVFIITPFLIKVGFFVLCDIY
jgi:hypothetical protein